MLHKNKLKYLILFWAGLFVFASPVFSKKVDDLWQKGNTFYNRKQYDSALSCYRQIEKSGYQNAALYLNMGNVFYRLGETAPAVLYYEKALFKDPLNKEIKDNLNLAESRVALPVAPSAPVFFISWWNKFILIFAPQVWAWLMFFCFVAALWLLYKRIKEKGGLNFIGRWFSFAVAGLAVSGICFYASYHARTFSNKAVVMKDDTPFFTDPNSTQTSGQLPEGAVVKIQGTKDGWYSITLPNGSRAWVSANNVEKVQS